MRPISAPARRSPVAQQVRGDALLVHGQGPIAAESLEDVSIVCPAGRLRNGEPGHERASRDISVISTAISPTSRRSQGRRAHRTVSASAVSGTNRLPESLPQMRRAGCFQPARIMSRPSGRASVRRPLDLREVNAFLHHLVQRRQFPQVLHDRDDLVRHVVDLFLRVEAANPEADGRVRHIVPKS
jgi:hypothetical protein